MHIVLVWAACLSQAGAADLRQLGRAISQTHEHNLHLGPQCGHHLLHHCEQKHTITRHPLHEYNLSLELAVLFQRNLKKTNLFILVLVKEVFVHSGI